MKNYYIIDKEVLDEMIKKWNQQYDNSDYAMEYDAINNCTADIIELRNSSRLVTEGEEAQGERFPSAEDIKRWFQLFVGKGEEAMDADMEKFFQSQEQKGEKGK